MLKDMLKAINKDGYLSRTLLAGKLKLPTTMIDQGIDQLLRMGYIAKEATNTECISACVGCPYVQNCSKEIVPMYKLTEKGIKAAE